MAFIQQFTTSRSLPGIKTLYFRLIIMKFMTQHLPPLDWISDMLFLQGRERPLKKKKEKKEENRQKQCEIRVKIPILYKTKRKKL